MLALCGTMFFLAVKLFGLFSGRSYRGNSLKKRLCLSYGNNTAEITALLDTGNSLIDPITLSPVIVAEYRSIKHLFNDDIKKAVKLDHFNKTN